MWRLLYLLVQTALCVALELTNRSDFKWIHLFIFSMMALPSSIVLFRAGQLFLAFALVGCFIFSASYQITYPAYYEWGGSDFLSYFFFAGILISGIGFWLTWIAALFFSLKLERRP